MLADVFLMFYKHYCVTWGDETCTSIESNFNLSRNVVYCQKRCVADYFLQYSPKGETPLCNAKASMFFDGILNANFIE